MHNKKTTKMTRFAILAVTLGALSWPGDAFVSTIASSETTIREASNLPRCHTPCECHSPYSVPRRRGRPQEVSVYPHFSSSNLYSVISHRRSSSLTAVLLNDSSSSGRGERGGRGQKPDDSDKKGPGWHRRILGKIPWRRQSQGLRPGGGPKYVSSSSLPFASVEQERPDLLVESYGVYRDDFVIQNFDALTPESVLPIVQVDQKKKKELLSSKPHSSSKLEVSPKPPATLDSEYLDVSITPAVYDEEGKTTKKGDHTKKGTSSSLTTRTTSSSANTSRKGMIGRVLENILTERIGQRWTTESPEGLKVDVRSSPDKYYNNLGRLLFKGLYRADATLSSGRIVFPNIRFSSVRFELEQVTLNLMGFFSSRDNNANQNQDQGRMPQQQQKGQKQKQSRHQTTDTVRYPNQFDIHIEDLTMSRHDLLFSSCIKNGLRGLLINILKDRGVRSNSIRITSIDILVSRDSLYDGRQKVKHDGSTLIRSFITL